VKTIMQKHNLHSVQFLPCSIESKKGKIEGYYLLHCYSYLLDKIDCTRTSFSRIWPYPREVEEAYGFISLKKLRSEIKKYAGHVSYITPDSGYFFNGFDHSNCDMFKISYINDLIYISSKLKTSLEESGVIGFEYFSIKNHFPQ
jgi:hypothetical protein